MDFYKETQDNLDYINYNEEGAEEYGFEEKAYAENDLFELK